MEDNKKNAKILSDEELENVAGGAVPRTPNSARMKNYVTCPKIKDEKSCKTNFGDMTWDVVPVRNGGCTWRDGKCVPFTLDY